MVFFFQAEDGIRARNVTGVQTCALPIWCATTLGINPRTARRWLGGEVDIPYAAWAVLCAAAGWRSEERRVGKARSSRPSRRRRRKSVNDRRSMKHQPTRRNQALAASAAQ